MVKIALLNACDVVACENTTFKFYLLLWIGRRSLGAGIFQVRQCLINDTISSNGSGDFRLGFGKRNEFVLTSKVNAIDVRIAERISLRPNG